jgi:hypothetical protein
VGHRVGGNDLAILTLTNPVRGAPTYRINTGQIPDERRPTLETVVVGWGAKGNGTDGAVASFFTDKRQGTNRVDQFGDGTTTYTPERDRPQAPPRGTLVFDFDSGDAPNTTSLRNYWDEEFNGWTGPTEGSTAPGDSGGPMFQSADGGDMWYLVGVHSSVSDSTVHFGTVAYDTRVQSYAAWITSAVPEPSPVLLLGLGGCALVAARRRRRTAARAGGAPC